jgi:hypothetical protein
LVSDSNSYYGTCTTNGTAVTRVSGSSFLNFSTTIIINSTTYAISSVTDANNIVLMSSAGIQPIAVPYTIGSFAAIVGAGLENGKVRLSSDGLDYITVEAGLNARQALSIVGSALSGQLSGGGGNALVFKAAGDPRTQRILAQVDNKSNRTLVTIMPPT